MLHANNVFQSTPIVTHTHKYTCLYIYMYIYIYIYIYIEFMVGRVAQLV